MPSSIETFFAAVETAYEAELAPAQQGLIVWRYGAEYIAASTAWPRIVCVRPAQTYTPITRAGTTVTPGASYEGRSRYNRVSTIEWHCWAVDDTAAEAFVENLVVVCRNVAGGSATVYRPVAVQWPAQQARGITDGGAYAVLTIELTHVISDAFIALAEIAVTTQTHTGTFGPDNETVC